MWCVCAICICYYETTLGDFYICRYIDKVLFMKLVIFEDFLWTHFVYAAKQSQNRLLSDKYCTYMNYSNPHPVR